MQQAARITPLALALAACFVAAPASGVEPDKVLKQSKKRVPAPPWGTGDERGMANAIGPGTWSRCAWHMAQPGAKSYELSYIRSNTMPKSPFSGPYVQKYKPTSSVPGTVHAFNGEEFEAGAEPAQQATQMDPLGHFGYLKQPWDGKPPVPVDQITYYGGWSQKEVKPTPDSPLLKLGMEKAPPLVTTAVLLDAKTFVGRGEPMKAGEVVSAHHIEGMLKAQGLAKRGILPGDVVYIYTGWGDYWKDPDTDKTYYTKAPGLGIDAAHWLAERRIVAIGLDTPFIDPAAEGMLQGKAGPAPGVPKGQAFAVHHFMLTQAGIHHIENAKLGDMAREKVWTSCTMVLPLRENGGAGSAIRPVAIGVPKL